MTLKKNIVFSLFSFIFLTSQAQLWKEHGKLQVSKDNPHYLAFEDGNLYFGWLILAVKCSKN